MYTSLRKHPSCVFQNGLFFRPLVTLLYLLAVVPGGRLHDFDKAAVIAGHGMEAHHFGNLKNGMLCAAQKVAGF